MLSFDGYECVYTQRHTRAKSKKHSCIVPVGIKLVLSCTVISWSQLISKFLVIYLFPMLLLIGFLLLNQARADSRPVHAWFLKIAFVREVSICMNN